MLKQLGVVHRGEEGQLSIITLLVILGFVLLVATLFNSSVVVQQKLELQNAADGIAQSAGTKMARGLNAVTAANHLIGELQALVVLHHGLGGGALDRGNTSDLTPSRLRSRLSRSHQSAVRESVTVPRPNPSTYAVVSQQITVEGAIGDSKRQLKRVARSAYHVHALGAFLADKGGHVPFIGPALRALGQEMVFAAMTVCEKVHQEWMTLNAMESLARIPLRALKIAGREVIRTVHGVSLEHASETPAQMESAASVVGEAQGTTGSLFPGMAIQPSQPALRLPVVPEPRRFPVERLDRSQLVRASTPWVQHWRLPLLQLGERSLRLGRFKSHYVESTQNETLKQAEAAKEAGVNLLVLDDYQPISMEKGTEPWTRADGSRLCDERFAVVGFAYRSAPLRMGPAYFQNVNRDGIAAFAQAMAYNANPQRPESHPAGIQVEVGWDTLNWLGADVPEWELGNDPNPGGDTRVSYFRQRAPLPRIALNWQTLLTPTTRIEAAAESQAGPLGIILQRTSVDLPLARTH
ncbi:MAG: hypothetical protein H7062_13865 [Candidatus Saccharimonas sp.]|nr:hypothetical protein [Planctomycetaceae bacterium]